MPQPSRIGDGSLSRPPRPGRWRRACLFLLVSCAAVGLLAPTLVRARPVRDAIFRLAYPSLAGRLEIDRVSGGWLTPLEAHGVRYRDEDFEFSAESVQTARTLLDLLKEPRQLGRIELAVARVSFAAPRVAVDASDKPSGQVREPAPGHSPASGHAPAWPGVSVQLEAQDSALIVVGPDGSEWRASVEELTVAAAPGSDRASFRCIARTGDAACTAHVSLNGLVAWPFQSFPDSLLEAHVELVGVDTELGLHALSVVVPSTRLLTGSDGQSVRVGGVVSGYADVHRTADHAIELRSNLELERVTITEPTSGLKLHEPAGTINAIVSLLDDTLRCDAIRLQTESLTIDGAGEVCDLGGDAQADFEGFALYNWKAIETRLRAVLPDGVHFAGAERRPWRLRGPLRGSRSPAQSPSLQAEWATHLESAEVAGIKLESIELKAHWNDRGVLFEPVQASLQGGRLNVQPRLVSSGDGFVLALESGRVLDGIEIDRALHDSFLCNMDPLFELAGNLSGRLSLDVSKLEVPLCRGGLNQAKFEGHLALEQVEIEPSQSLRDILVASGVEPAASVRVSQTIPIRLASGRVHHAPVPLTIGSRQIVLEGSVGLDHTLDMRLKLPVTEQMLGNDERLYRLLRGRYIEIAVAGTVENPDLEDDVVARNIQRLIQMTVRDSLRGDDPLRGLLRRVLK
jgi:hypothetical protein